MTTATQAPSADTGRAGPTGPRWVTRLAQIATEGLAPWVLAAGMPLVVALESAPTVAAGLGWGLFAAACSSAAPMARILAGVRRGTITDHHVSRREQRRGPMLLGAATVLFSLAVATAGGAPRPLVALIAVMLTVLIATGIVNLWWKLSGHLSVGAGSLAVLTVTYGPVLLPAVVLLAWVGWSRLHLRAHTAAQVWAGAAVGAALSWPLFVLISRSG
jgi:hypothetical protein